MLLTSSGKHARLMWFVRGSVTPFRGARRRETENTDVFQLAVPASTDGHFNLPTIRPRFFLPMSFWSSARLALGVSDISETPKVGPPPDTSVEATARSKVLFFGYLSSDLISGIVDIPGYDQKLYFFNDFSIFA